jgi:hypothetical protein
MAILHTHVLGEDRVLYTIIASVSNRPNGEWKYATHCPTFYLDSRTQGIVSIDHAADIAHRMLADLIRQDLAAGAVIHINVVDEEGNYVTR